MYVTTERAVDNRHLVRVTFERQTPDSQAPMIEVTYEVRFPGDSYLTEDSAVIIPLSIVRQDTRERILLTDEERDMCHQAGAEKAIQMAREH